MKKNKLFFNSLSLLPITLVTSVVSCNLNANQKQVNLEGLTQTFDIKNVEKSVTDATTNAQETAVFNDKKDQNANSSDTRVFSDVDVPTILDQSSKKPKKIKKDKAAEKAAKQAQIEKLKQQLDTLEKNNVQEEEKLKSISAGSYIISTITSGITSGLGAWFWTNGSKSQLDEEIEKLKKENEKLKENKPEYLQESLKDVFEKMLDVAFEKELPYQLINFIDKYIIMNLFRRHPIDIQVRDQIINKFKASEIKVELRKFVSKLLERFTKIRIDHDDEYIIQQTKDEIVKLMPDIIYKLVSFIIDILANPARTTKGYSTSIAAAVILNILKDGPEFNLDIVKTQFSKVLYHILHLFVDRNNTKDIFRTFIYTFSEQIRDHKFTLNAFNDLIIVLNKTIKILYKESNNKISIDKILMHVIPNILNDIEYTDDMLDDFVDFANRLFVETREQIYKVANLFITLAYTDTENKAIKEGEFFVQEDKPQKRRVARSIKEPEIKYEKLDPIEFPDIQFDFPKIVSLILNSDRYISFFKRFISKLYEPFIRAFIRDITHLEKTKAKVKNFNPEDIKSYREIPSFRALFRVITFSSYLLHKAAGFNRYIFFERYLNFNPLALGNIIPEIINNLFNQYAPDFNREANKTSEVFQMMFGKMDTKNTWEQAWGYIKWLFTNNTNHIEEKDNIFTMIKYNQKEKIKSMLLLGYYESEVTKRGGAEQWP